MRLDEYISTAQNISRSKAQALIKDGLVFVDKIVCNKPSKEVKDGQNITIKEHDEYVSRGAYKLLSAINEFGLDFKDKVVLDMGASTGGFTQVALLHGAKKVYAVDVGRGQLDKLLQKDLRVKNMENCDVRKITRAQCPDVDIIVGDLSFISLTKVLPYIKENFSGVPCAILFKPQFECGKQLAKKCGGVIKDKKLHIQLLKSFVNFLKENHFKLSGLTYSQIAGGDGNIEYLFYLNGACEVVPQIEESVENAFKRLK